MAEEEQDAFALVVRKRTLYGVDCWWIGRGRGKQFALYADIHAPTGYGFRSKAKAERRAAEIEAAAAKPKRRAARR